MKPRAKRKLMKYRDLMIDIETMGVTPKSPILSIGAVEFDRLTGDFGREFEVVINFEKAIDDGELDGSTVAWWLKQSDEARNALFADEGYYSTEDVLTELSYFVDQSQYVWGNGATFDISILEEAMRKHGVDIPWKFYNIRDVRTVVDLANPICPRKPFEDAREGAHTALGDAKHQATYTSAMIQALYSLGE